MLVGSCPCGFFWSLSTVTVHARLPTSVRLTVVTELSEVRAQAAIRVNK